MDVVLYLDRLDLYRVEKTDQEMMAAISNTLGPKIWKNTVIGLTHGKAIPPQNFFTDRQGRFNLDSCVLAALHELHIQFARFLQQGQKLQ